MSEKIIRFLKRGIILISIFIGMFLILITPINALEKVISNSADWRDVYSSMLYASLIDKQPGLFLTSAKHGSVLPLSISKGVDGILIISSKSKPYIINYKNTLDAQGYKNVEEITSNNINIDLAKRLIEEKGIKKFIIVDDAYGYNALSAAPYAVIDKFYVLFANERNIGQIDNILTNANPTKIIIFGQVDEAVKTRLAKYNPEIINKGDRFDNNIEIVKKYQQIKNSKQIIMSNGEFIEASLMSGQDPVLYIGFSNVPIQVQEYIKESGFQVAVLIGNELINSATTIRRQLGISVFVKFAQGARNPEGAISLVEDLDRFPMPKYTLNLEIYSILYNKALNQLWVTYRNAAGLGTYLQGTIRLFSDGQLVGFVGEKTNTVFIDKNQYKTISYDLSAENIVLTGENITAEVYTIFGEGRRSLEYILQGTFNIEVVEILDEALINITDIFYDKGRNIFVITIKNIGNVDAYVSGEIIDLYMNGEYKIVGSDQPILIKPGKTGKLKINAELSETDIKNNPIIKIKIYYGERENSLIKTIEGEYALKIAKVDIVYYTLIFLIIILLILIIIGKKKCKNCGTKNSRLRKNCKKCGHPLYKKKIQHEKK